MTPADMIAKRLAAASSAYYAGAPLIDDKAWDALRGELKRLAPSHPFFQKVGAPTPSGITKVAHATKMGSLTTIDEDVKIVGWMTSVEKMCADKGLNKPQTFVVQDKLDGLSVQLSYRQGLLITAALRGDGNEGEVVTDNVRKAQGIPLSLYDDINVDVRGEMVILKSDFDAHFKPRGDSNARNSAAGTVRNSSGVLADKLTFIAFDANAAGAVPEAVLANFSNEVKLSAQMTAWGFRAVGTEQHAWDSQKLLLLWKERGEDRGDLPYLVDGLVVKMNGRKTAEALGWADSCPRSAIAAKWKGGMVADTVVTGIRLSVGHTGTITPVALVDPVECGGVKVSNISLMNWDELGRLGAVGIGAKVRIERAGDVIPRIVSVLEPSSAVFTRPTNCPSCDALTVVDGPRQMCVSPNCPAQAHGTLMRWVKGRNILHLGPETVDKLMAVDGPLRSIPDFYDLNADQIALASNAGMAPKIQAELEKSRDCAPFHVFGNIGITGIGETEAAKVCDYLDADTLEEVVNANPAAFVAALGPVRGANFAKGLAENLTTIARLSAALRIKKPVQKAGPLSGCTVCCTGASELSRDLLISLVEKAGGTYKTSVVNGLTYLVAADVSADKTKWSNKLKEADRKGVTVISESDILIKIGYANGGGE